MHSQLTLPGTCVDKNVVELADAFAARFAERFPAEAPLVADELIFQYSRGPRRLRLVPRDALVGDVLQRGLGPAGELLGYPLHALESNSAGGGYKSTAAAVKAPAPIVTGASSARAAAGRAPALPAPPSPGGTHPQGSTS